MPDSSAAHVAAQEFAPRKIAVSAGVISGNKLGGTIPQYPAIARAVRAQDPVVLNITISKDGTVTSATPVSGDPALVEAAIKAVLTWRYKPYEVDGKPVEIESSVTVDFH